MKNGPRCKYDFIEGRPGWIACQQCGHERKLVPNNHGLGGPPDLSLYVRPCSLKLLCEQSPDVLQMAVNFSGALKRHALNGRKVRSEEEIRAIYAICSACPLLQDGRCNHEKCGCNVSPDPTRWLNKLAWQSEHCPIDQW